jgi:uncharacterized protein (TIGR03083 family)
MSGLGTLTVSAAGTFRPMATSSADDQIAALEESVVRLRSLVAGLDGAQLRTQAYPTEWTVADVLSHVGSGAEIQRLGLDAALGLENLPDDFAPPIWDTWNAKSPEDKAADVVVADRVLMDRLASLDEREQAVEISLGPITVDLVRFVGLRLNEHAMHTWDIEVVFDPSVTVPSSAAALVLDNLPMMVQFVGKPTGRVHDLHVRTSDPARDFTLALGADAITLAPCSDAHAPDLELPAEALARLAYGRLDRAHTPAGVSGADLDELRRVFPGV